jgi:hypothetical protein
MGGELVDRFVSESVVIGRSIGGLFSELPYLR